MFKNLLLVGFMFPLGFGQATCNLVGTSLGKFLPNRARMLTEASIIVMTAISTVKVLLLYLF